MTITNLRPEVKGKMLTVAELIELLLLYPQDAKVYHEGCDGCYGEADRVVYDDSDNTILIGRCN